MEFNTHHHCVCVLCMITTQLYCVYDLYNISFYTLGRMMVNVSKTISYSEIKDDRIHIGLNEYGIYSVYFFPVSACKYQHELLPSTNTNFICIDRDASMLFLEREYFTILADCKCACQYITYYPKRDVWNILDRLEHLVQLLQNEIDNPSLGEGLDDDMVNYCEEHFDLFFYKVVSTLANDNAGLNYMKVNRTIILDFYQRFIYYMRELFMKEPCIKYLCAAAAF